MKGDGGSEMTNGRSHGHVAIPEALDPLETTALLAGQGRHLRESE
jgi:hypothetical protein